MKQITVYKLTTTEVRKIRGIKGVRLLSLDNGWWKPRNNSDWECPDWVNDDDGVSANLFTRIEPLAARQALGVEP